MYKAIIIEDEYPTMELMKFMLERSEKYTIIGTFSNPLEALEYIGQLSPDVTFIDIEMPKMNGFELAKQIRNQNFMTEIVFATAYKKYEQEAKKLDIIDFIHKPVTFNAILNITKMIDMKRS